ncbi:YheC/YheD family protein [Metabacillus halosaccharovorans]|uniref:YheC/YheD family protein n=1 Tax=Metabacillus halosaccharovorans TaxID=930124 RepID=UPI00203CA0CD|nr:YheC/YheD family protein [Metabacillus halosaccharovorans]MCM3439707.1 YheC/YheD family protein [Metabacillus halosaccharovorans]
MKYSRGKWAKYRFLIKNESLVPFVPETELFNEEVLWEFIEKYGQVVVKPSWGRRGKGVFSIKKIDQDVFEFHSEMNKFTITGEEKLLNKVERSLIKEKNIVQKGIPLSTINGSPFDLRIMVQRKKESEEWVVTGMLAKVASKNYFITNVTKKVLDVQSAIEQSNISVDDTNELVRTLEKISLIAAQELSGYYPKQQIFGLDIGLDEAGKPWIFEVNCNPSFVYFKQLKDKQMMSKIREYKKN